jgi:serine/threonine protein kinase
VEGQTFSQYRVLEKIGEGGMGQVYLAEDTSLERKVALKFLPEYLQQDETAHKRFIREAKSAAAIEHPFICNIKEVAQTDDGQDFIVMEYVQGRTRQEANLLDRCSYPAIGTDGGRSCDFVLVNSGGGTADCI